MEILLPTKREPLLFAAVVTFVIAIATPVRAGEDLDARDLLVLAVELGVIPVQYPLLKNGYFNRKCPRNSIKVVFKVSFHYIDVIFSMGLFRLAILLFLLR